MFIVSKLCEVIKGMHTQGVIPDALFIDATGIGAGVFDRMRQLGHRKVFEVQFSWRSPDKSCYRLRTYIWNQMKEWLELGGCLDPKHQQLAIEISSPEYKYNNQDQIQLESKEDMKRRLPDLGSPDSADALAITWSAHVAPRMDKPKFGESEALYGGGRYNGGAGRGRRGTPWI